jgi:hypothetical protein
MEMVNGEWRTVMEMGKSPKWLNENGQMAKW